MKMKAKKYINFFSISLLFSIFMAPYVSAMNKENKTFLGKILTFSIPAVMSGGIAYNYFPDSAYNFLNPKHLYDVSLKTMPKFMSSAKLQGIELPRTVNIISPLNCLRSLLFSGIFHANNVKSATTLLAAGIAGCMALRFKRAGIFGVGGSDRHDIDDIVSGPGKYNKDQKLNLLAKFIPGSGSPDDLKDIIKRKCFEGSCPADDILGIPDKKKLKKATNDGDKQSSDVSEKTCYQKYYFKIDDAAESVKFYKKYPAICARYFLRKPKEYDLMVNKINKINYAAYTGSAIAGSLIFTLLQLKFFDGSFNAKKCLLGGFAGLALRFSYLRIQYPTRYYAAEKFCKIYNTTIK